MNNYVFNPFTGKLDATGTGGGGAPTDATYLTGDDETTDLANSIQVGNIDGIMKCDGSSNFSAAVEGTDYLSGALTTLVKEPTGFLNPSGVVVTYDSSTQKITLSGTVAAYWRGVQVTALTSGWVSDAHPNVTGHNYFLYYNGTNFLWADNAFPGFDMLLIAVVYYRASNPFANRECHGFQQWESHQNDHYNIGTYRTTGGDISGITLASTTAAERRPNISACTIQDEDLTTVNAELTSETYTQRYISSTSTINYATSAAEIVPVSGANPYYNPLSGGNYVQTLMPANSVMTIWLFEVPCTADAASQEIRHVFVQGQSITQATNSSAGALVAARNTEKLKNPNELYLGEPTIVSNEYVCIHKFIIQYTGGNWTITDSIVLTGSRFSQTASASGAYLSGVTHDATLTGDGTALTPLGFNLANANTWTADQTFTVPNSSAAGTDAVSVTIGDTQTNACQGIELTLGSSAVGHTGVAISMANASTSARGITINPSTTGTGYGIAFTNYGGTGFRGMYWQYINDAPGGSRYGIWQDYISSGGSAACTGYGIYQNKVCDGLGTGYGFYQSIVSGGSTAYGIYQDRITDSTSTGYGIYQNYIGYSSGTSYGWYVANIGYINQNNGRYFSLNNAQSGAIASRTNDASECLFSRTNTATTGTIADNFNLFYFKRTSIQNGVGGTLTAAGSVLALENVATQTAGTLTDTVDVLKLIQDADSTGYALRAIFGATDKFLVGANAITTGADTDLILGTYAGTPSVGGAFRWNGTNLYFFDGATARDLLAAGGFAWGATASGTSGTGLALTVSNSADASTIGQSITIGDTQTNTVYGLKVSTGTSARAHAGIYINSTFAGTTQGGGGIVIDSYTSATQKTIDMAGISIGYNNNNNSNSTKSYAGINITNIQNAGTGYNTGIYVLNASTELDVDGYVGGAGGTGAGISVYQTGAAGTAFHLYGSSNVNSSTNGLVNFTLSNTQSGASVMQKIDLGTSAQGHTGLLIQAYNASTSCYGTSIQMSTTGTGIAYKANSSILAGGEQLLNLAHAASGTLTACTQDKSTISSSRTHTAATSVTDNYNVTSLTRTNVNTNASGTLVASGSVLNISNTATPTAGTLTDSVHLLKLTQDADSTGYPIYITQNAVVSTNYRKIFTESNTGITFWMGNGTTANGNLSGTAGDILINGGSNKPEYCTGTTTWVALV